MSSTSLDLLAAMHIADTADVDGPLNAMREVLGQEAVIDAISIDLAVPANKDEAVQIVEAFNADRVAEQLKPRTNGYLLVLVALARNASNDDALAALKPHKSAGTVGQSAVYEMDSPQRRWLFEQSLDVMSLPQVAAAVRAAGPVEPVKLPVD